MRNVVWLVLLFAVAVVAALTLGDNAGMASFYWEGWRVDLSLNLFILGALATGFALMTAVQAVNALIGLPARAREWRLLRLERAAQAALREALAEYFSGRYGRSHKAAQRAIAIQDDRQDAGDDHEFRTLAQLLAAGSLHRLQNRGRRDELLRRALRPGRRGASQAVDDGARLLAAEWALDDRDGPRAEALLAELQPGVARRTQALRLKLQAARLERRPMDALHTARLLANHQAFSSTAAQGLLRSLAIEALDATHDADQLRRAWQDFDAADQRDPFVAARAARRAAQLQAAEDGRAWLRPLWDRLDSLGADGRAEVALALVDVVAGLGPDWLARVETAQRSHPTEAAVQAAVGAVLAERQLWGKARRPLEIAAKDAQLQPRARRQAWRALARLATEEGDDARALDCLRQAAAQD
ncbi:heme biosynthesis HemY N-terminal domain-containing protein [Pseudaquabacterium pictum]|uniref:Porphyrin biosynthesis-like protein n=1 Tax=Pseudaquabacterium pictum TaxID=2315236 RepID=A0A480ALC6_9BURK|nr:heme biosynthesis HemY N-terminal domain-containing protein [Rubrivivax pictus]GCL62384.1 porphyrin biosynthesis-like protein [Rubrivivax pictus]